MGCGNSCRDGSTEAVRAPRRYPNRCEHAAGRGSRLLHGNSGALPGSDTLTGRPRDRVCPGSPERGGSVSGRLRREGEGPRAEAAVPRGGAPGPPPPCCPGAPRGAARGDRPSAAPSWGALAGRAAHREYCSPRECPLPPRPRPQGPFWGRYKPSEVP